MQTVKRGLSSAYWSGLIVLCIYVIVSVEKIWSFVTFHAIAFWIPPVGILVILSGQFDLLLAIRDGEKVNIEARIYDFIHWALLLSINVGAWMIGGVSQSWFWMQLLLLSVIGWQIGEGLRSYWKLTASAVIARILFSACAVFLGLLIGFLRQLDYSLFGPGWGFEVISAIVATVIVFRWILLDLETIRTKGVHYPRSFFLKGIFSNALVIWFWASIMLHGGFGSFEWWLRNAGLGFNVLVGNAIYLWYWGMYEYYEQFKVLRVI